MFTGIVEAVGSVVSRENGVLRVRPTEGFGADGFATGESIAVNGCCLTVVPDSEGLLRFDLSPETMDRTTFGGLEPGDRVNLERAMRADGRFGGHIVQGHVDAVGEIVGIQPEGNSVVFTFQIPPDLDRYLIDKASICLDGVSLTVVRPQDGRFEVWVIPHTLEVTGLGAKQVGDRVNVEIDVLAKHLEKLAAGPIR